MCIKSSKGKPCFLKVEEIIERLCTDDQGVIDDIYNMSAALFDREEKRANIIDTKANFVMGIAGVALSLMWFFSKCCRIIE